VTDEVSHETTLQNLIYLGPKDSFMVRVAKISGATYNQGWAEGFIFGLFIASATAIAVLFYLMFKSVL
jgi:hypothetical protein